MTKPTGWDTGLCQDYSRGLSRWFASRLDARHTIRRWFGEQRKMMSDAIDPVVLKMQRDNLRDALRKVLDANEREAKARMSWQNARENFSDSIDERKAHERAMLAACNAEREARTLLLTLRDEA